MPRHDAPLPCPDCGGDMLRSRHDPSEPYVYCVDCDWQGEDNLSRLVGKRVSFVLDSGRELLGVVELPPKRGGFDPGPWVSVRTLLRGASGAMCAVGLAVRLSEITGIEE